MRKSADQKRLFNNPGIDVELYYWVSSDNNKHVARFRVHIIEYTNNERSE